MATSLRTEGTDEGADGAPHNAQVSGGQYSKMEGVVRCQGEARRAEQTAARLINDIGWSTPLTWPSVNSSVSFAPSTAGALLFATPSSDRCSVRPNCTTPLGFCRHE